MLNDNEFSTSKIPFERTYESYKTARAIDELIKSTFPLFNLRERIALGCIIQSIWDIPFTVAMYDEVVFRLKRNEKKLFPSKKIIDKTLSDLCASRILKTEISEFGDGKPSKWKKQRILKLPEAFLKKGLNVIAHT